MFLLAITNEEIASALQSQSYEINDFKIDSLVVTIVTDNFLSTFISDENGFSLIESPLLSHHNLRDIIFSQVTYTKKSNSFEILKSTISGRPIYYHIDSKGNFFCSTHISMLRKSGVLIEENTDVLPEFFYYRYVMPPATLYKNIRQLLAGSHVIIKLENGKCKIVREEFYIPPTSHEKEAGHIDSISNSTLSLLNDSIQDLSPGKDRISVLLSGGLDSSILFKICQSRYGIDTTYSTGFPFENPTTNIEKEYALSAADAFKTKHSYCEVSNEEYLRGIIKGISAAEEPLIDLHSGMLHSLFKEGIPQNKNIVINAAGADATWGFDTLNVVYLNNKPFFKLLLKYPQIKLTKIASDITGRYGEFIETSMRIQKDYAISDPRNIIWSDNNVSEEWVNKYFGIKKSDIIKGRYNTIRQFERRSIYDILSIYFALLDIPVWQSVWSKIGESQGKILYWPYYNDKLLNYAYSIPWELKLKKPKNILREVARKCGIPEFIITRRKTGFAIKDNHWGERGNIFEALVPLSKKVFDEKQLRDMQSTDPKKAMTYWNILNYSIWKRLCINNEPVEILLDELN